jgi:ABC-type glycerol-3-phosphate transport system substrate-binding protein
MTLFYDYLFYRIGLVTIFVAGFFLVMVTGCQISTTVPTEDTPTPVAEASATARPVTTPIARVSPTVIASATPEDNTIVLTFWTVESISPEAEGDVGDFMSSNLRAFELANADVDVELQLKKATGKGGVVDFLRTSKTVAPSVLPDIAIMNATDLNQAFSEGLIQPLDGRLDRSIVQDLLPAARKMGTVGDKLVGVPLGLEMEHIVYNTLVFTATPMLWTDVLSGNTQYLFPAKGVNGLVNSHTLSQYFSNGGEFLDDQGTPKINEGVLRTVLEFYHQGVESGIIDASILEAATTEELWPTYLQGQAGLTQISVSQYLTDRELLNSSMYAPIPIQTEENIPVAITNGWALVLVTDDPARQKAALNLIEWFLSTNKNATWNNINKSIPSRDTAYQQLAGDDPYWEFLTEQLNTARPHPSFPGYDQIGRILQQAVQQVISGEATPEEATATAIDALTQQ